MENDKKICPVCKGMKKIDPFGDGRMWNTCPNCGGKGWIPKKDK